MYNVHMCTLFIRIVYISVPCVSSDDTNSVTRKSGGTGKILPNVKIRVDSAEKDDIHT